MSTVTRDAQIALSVLLTLPILAVWAFALVDIVRRRDLPPWRRTAYAAIVVLVVPATLLYLLARPTSLVRHRDRRRDDWRAELVGALDTPGVAVAPSQRRELLAHLEPLRDAGRTP